MWAKSFFAVDFVNYDDYIYKSLVKSLSILIRRQLILNNISYFLGHHWTSLPILLFLFNFELVQEKTLSKTIVSIHLVS